MASMEYCIDRVKLRDGIVYIDGWAYDPQTRKVDIEVEGIEFKKDLVRRDDLYRKFDEQEESVNAGFQLIFPYVKQVKVIFKYGDNKESVTINVKEEVKDRSKSDKAKKVLRMINIPNIKKGIKEVSKNGIKKTYYKVKSKVRTSVVAEQNYDAWFRAISPSEEELERQRNEKFNFTPLISIVVPTYNTKPDFLKAMIESVRNQTYSNWELCIADGASTNQDTINMLKEYEKIDNRIKVKYLKENYMISGNTNEGLKLVSGDYVALLDHDDLLTENALYEYIVVLNKDKDYEFIYSDEDKIDEKELEYFGPHFKQDWAPDTLRSYNYITHFSVFSKTLLEKAGDFNSEFDGSQDFDIILRLTENAKKVYHIPKILYHWRVHNGSTAAGIDVKPYAIEAGRRAIEEHLKRKGIKGIVKRGNFSGCYKVEYEIVGNPKVSIIIPNKDQAKTLKKCVDSILQKSTYKNYEIIIVENNSVEPQTTKYYEQISKNDKVKIVKWDKEFNYAAINNFGVKQASGDYILLLNNDTEVIKSKWIEELLMHAQMNDVGIVGGKLYYPDDTIQHAGIVVGVNGVADHIGKGFGRYENGHMGRLLIKQNVSAVTGACLMIRKNVYEEVGGLTEEFAVAFNDIDLCMKVREKGYNIVFNPYVELYHYESKSRGLEDTPEKLERFNKEIELFYSKWGKNIIDPYYNINFSRKLANYSLNEEMAQI